MRLSIGTLGGTAVVLVVLLAFVTGCGGSSAKSGAGTTTTSGSGTTTTKPATSSAIYTLARTRACLNGDSGVHAYLNEHNTVVQGSGGELRVDFGYGFQWIYIAFGKDTQEAQAIEDHAVAATLSHDDKLDRKTVLAGVRKKGNVFYYADGGPVTENEGSQVDACLK